MQRYIILSLTAFVAAFGATFWTMSAVNMGRAREASGHEEAYRLLHREAELISHFCLSRIPPVIGKEAIPAEWQKALGTTILLRQGAGEAIGESAALGARVNEIQTLQTGESVAVTATDAAGAKHWLVYKPESSGNLLLVLSKSAATAAQQMRQSATPNRWLTSLIAALVVAFITGIAAKLLFTPTRKTE